MFKNQKGISLSTMIITVLLISIILATLIYSGTSGIKSRRLNQFYTDLRTLNDSVSMYYLKNKELPVKTISGYNITLSKSSESEDVSKLSCVLKDQTASFSKDNLINPNDCDDSDPDNPKAVYYEIDLGLLDNISLKNTGTYIINEQSQTIYYVEGIVIDNVRYYGLPYTYMEI